VVPRRRVERLVQLPGPASHSQPNKTAIIFEADDGAVTKITYKQLYHRVCQFANGLKSLGIKTGDRVIIYMPMSIEAVVAMQACARIGATHSSVWRLLGQEPTGAHHRRRRGRSHHCRRTDAGGKEIPLKPAVDDAFAMGGCEGIRT